MSGSWYNGYSAKEREKKYRVLMKLIAKGELSPATGPCMLCGDPEVPVEYHDEDYGEPYIWEPPALLCLCRNCHRNKLHKRFNDPNAWYAYLVHVRRGGYARDLKDKNIKKEFEACRRAIENGRPYEMTQLRPYKNEPGKEWFSNVRMDLASLSDPSARPRP